MKKQTGFFTKHCVYGHRSKFVLLPLYLYTTQYVGG